MYDKPATPFERLLTAEVLSPTHKDQLRAYRDNLTPAAIGRAIADLQAVLLTLAKDKTERLYPANFSPALPDVRKGIRVKAS